VIRYSLLKVKGLFPQISKSEAEELWCMNETVICE
jgi:hypothetical protein